jgi:heme A synthase
MKFNRFATFAWSALAFNLLVIVWGAYVRASSSGAGCGSHWPLCNGEIIPTSPTIKTIVEYSHRLSSGLALLMVVTMLVWAFRSNPRKHPLRYTTALSMGFMLMEAAIGAGLVLFEMVAENKSIARAMWISAHLINTFLLIGMLTLTAWVATTGERSKLRGQGMIAWMLAISLVATLALGVSGAISALGATLFPVTSLNQGLRQDLSPTAHILERLRIFHPFIALVVSGLLLWTAALARSWRSSESVRKLSALLTGFVLFQLAIGAVNLLLHAPVWLQLTHLLLSDLVWISLVLLGFTAMAQPAHEQPTVAIRSAQMGESGAL